VLGRFKYGEDIAPLSAELNVPEDQVLAAIRVHTATAA
jgi:HD superfamily phosphohydrolase YqeK